MENNRFTEQELVSAIEETLQQSHIFISFLIQAVDRAVNNLVGDDKYKYADNYSMFLAIQSGYIIDNIIPELELKLTKSVPNIVKNIELSRLFANTEKDKNGK